MPHRGKRSVEKDIELYMPCKGITFTIGLNLRTGVFSNIWNKKRIKFCTYGANNNISNLLLPTFCPDGA